MQTKGGKNRCHLLGLWRPCTGNCAGTDFLSKKVRCTGRTARVRPVPPYCSCTFPHYLLPKLTKGPLGSVALL